MKTFRKQSLMVLGLLFFLLSCEDEILKQKNDEKNVLSRKMSSLSLPCSVPVLYNGMLAFEDEKQFTCYYNYLNTLIATPDDEMDEDDFLAEVEQYVGVSSLRADALAKFEQKNAVGWSSYQEIPEEHWITSTALRSILNTNREVKIGGYILRYINPDFIASVKDSQPELLKKVEALGDNPSLEDILNLDLTREFISVTSPKIYTREFGTIDFADAKGVRGTPVPLGRFSLSGTVYQNFTCSNPGTVKFEGFTLSHMAVPQRAKYRIEFNDGAGAYTEFTLGPNQYILPVIEHVYPGTTSMFYNPVVKVKSLGSFNSGPITWDMTRTFQVYVKGMNETCTMDARGGLQDLVINSSNVLRGKADYYTWKPFPFGLGGAISSLAGWTELHHIDKNGNWNRRKDKKTTLCVKFLGSLMHQNQGSTPYFCMDPIYPYLEYECRSNTNQKRMEKQMGQYNTNTRATAAMSYFTVQHEVGTSDGVKGYFKQTIYGCP
ncbi:MAG: hypothetical protein LBE92_00905 [Chryseobacterium sp.]|jgi:hypothetical protein|uniref:hypothetical protein n=1 Tax=Chryseobacterium sp. TaxID=1871047 RepID=UPI00281A0256|nr:hypothetical protein [Chryseobacterium sp.]MDR2234658.1 hypothetical protein [Chryseobacterium sp.]